MPLINEIDEVQDFKEVLKQIKKEMEKGFVKPDDFNNKNQKNKDVRIQNKRSRKDS